MGGWRWEPSLGSLATKAAEWVPRGGDPVQAPVGVTLASCRMPQSCTRGAALLAASVTGEWAHARLSLPDKRSPHRGAASGSVEQPPQLLLWARAAKGSQWVPTVGGMGWPHRAGQRVTHWKWSFSLFSNFLNTSPGTF